MEKAGFACGGRKQMIGVSHRAIKFFRLTEKARGRFCLLLLSPNLRFRLYTCAPDNAVVDAVSQTVFENRLLTAKVSADTGALAVRVATVLAALGILFWRTPTTFTNPQFWGDDILFFHGARTVGWASIATPPIAGYLTSVQYLVAVLASYA